LGIIYKREKDWSTWNVVRQEDSFTKKNFSVVAKRCAEYPQQCDQIATDWNEFKKTLPAKNIDSFFPEDYDSYRNYLKNKYKKICSKTAPEKYKSISGKEKNKAAIDELNRNWQRAFNNFLEILPLKCFLLQQKWFPPQRKDFNDLVDYHKQLPAAKVKVIPTEMLWALYLEKRFVNTAAFHKRTGIEAKQFSDISIPSKSDRRLYPLWQDFLKKKFPLRLITVNGNYAKLWQKQLENEFKTVAAFNRQTEENIKTFKDLKFSPTPPTHSILRMYWLDFVLKNVPVKDWTLNTPANLYHAFLRHKYKNISALNSAYATTLKNFQQVKLPLKLADYNEFIKNKTSIRWSFFAINYRIVIDFLFKKGRAIMVTILLVGLTILGALTVNPLAAYALSRGKQATASKILIFFLATMAFPAEVAMIPGFLLLRDLGLLNTLGALVLPGLANGYSIFLLKGFFDSIPRELYEAAEIDGANEFTKFWAITYPMSKPILAVIALSAFTMAYGGFMWAFLVCQDPKMWTIMVWLYDFQGRYAHQPGMCMAAFALASIPTLLVFLFCQKIIMRGIVIPTMK